MGASYFSAAIVIVYLLSCSQSNPHQAFWRYHHNVCNPFFQNRSLEWFLSLPRQQCDATRLTRKSEWICEQRCFSSAVERWGPNCLFQPFARSCWGWVLKCLKEDCNGTFFRWLCCDNRCYDLKGDCEEPCFDRFDNCFRFCRQDRARCQENQRETSTRRLERFMTTGAASQCVSEYRQCDRRCRGPFSGCTKNCRLLRGSCNLLCYAGKS